MKRALLGFFVLTLLFTAAAASAQTRSDPTARSGLVYNGTSQYLVEAGQTTFPETAWKYSVNGGDYKTEVPAGTDAGTYTVNYYFDAGADSTQPLATPLTINIAKATLTADDITLPEPQPTDMTYDGTAHYLLSKAGTSPAGTKWIYQVRDDEALKDSIPIRTDAAEYDVIAYVDGGNNYNDFKIKPGTTDQPIMFDANINPKVLSASDYTAPTGKTLGYTGKAQKLIKAGDPKNTGTMLYRPKSDSAEYSESLPVGVKIGTYEIEYTIRPNKNYVLTGTGPLGSITSKITPNDISSLSKDIKLSPSVFLYDGNYHRPSVSAGALVKGSDYALDHDPIAEKKEVGGYTVVLSGKAPNFTGTLALNWSIISVAPIGTETRHVLEPGKCTELSLDLTSVPAEITIDWRSGSPSVADVKKNGSGITASVCAKDDGETSVTAIVRDAAGTQKTFSWLIEVRASSQSQFYTLGSDEWTVIRENTILPATGFPAGVQTPLSLQPDTIKYAALNTVVMIPTLNVTTDIVTVPSDNGTLAVEWLYDFAGIPEGMSLPGDGHSVIVAHNHLNDAQIGPFLFLNELAENDRIFVDVDGDFRSFVVYANELLEADGIDRMIEIAETEDNSLVLLTCENEMVEGGYANRRAVFAKPR